MGLKFQKRATMTLKTFSMQNYMNMGIKTTQNFTLISKLLRRIKKIVNKKVMGKKSVQSWSLSSSILLTCKRFWQITFSGCTFFQNFHRFEISVRFCVFMILKCEKNQTKSCSRLLLRRRDMHS